MSQGLISDSLGEIRPTGDSYELVFERRLKRPVEKVWAALTVPERIADWLAKAEIDLRVGGRIALHWETHDYRMAGVITELDPPRLIAWTWPSPEHPDSVVRWELEPDGPDGQDGCRLTLTQSHLRRPVLLNVAAGWHTHMEGLAAADGVATPWRAEREREIVKLYKDRAPA
jgi:uncharacterized protein YndB with AHSA1/START domain